MIYDKMVNAKEYINLCPNLRKALEWIGQEGIEQLPVSDVSTPDGRFRFQIKEYVVSEEEAAGLVAHREYGEVWRLISGFENAKIAPLCDCKMIGDYDPAADTVHCMCTSQVIFPIAKDYFLIALPGDAHGHQPISSTDPIIRKAIVKFKLDK